jgi:hypothetical protein
MSSDAELKQGIMLAKPGAIVTRSETADVPPTEGCAELKHGVGTCNAD